METENDFETLILSFIEHKVGISNHFLSDILANHLKENLVELCKQKLLKTAGTGNENKLSHNALIRNDTIYWLDRKNNNLHENDFFDLIESFIKYLNCNCYTGITDYEFHYSLYEKGSFYTKHVDQFQNNFNRQYSMISYLNADWKTEDGGQLLIHQKNNNQKISPMQGKTVFFKSNELEHEVLLTNKRRMSVTGWLKRG
ncbi:MAG: 2OG-Fe(II) oxygenase [Bacteroidetes bacterium]|nr:MAG: 2OG-Fe(II) oxygenase [Bacteroidota bacterium]